MTLLNTACSTRQWWKHVYIHPVAILKHLLLHIDKMWFCELSLSWKCSSQPTQCYRVRGGISDCQITRPCTADMNLTSQFQPINLPSEYQKGHSSLVAIHYGAIIVSWMGQQIYIALVYIVYVTTGFGNHYFAFPHAGQLPIAKP